MEVLSPGETLTLRGRRVHSQLHFDINHTGRQLSKDELTLLFDPLDTTKPEARGLGLYLAREIIVAHQGEITVSSAPGMGATFTVTLPLLEEKDYWRKDGTAETGVHSPSPQVRDSLPA
jgi:signal transduction histidine kinase